MGKKIKYEQANKSYSKLSMIMVPVLIKTDLGHSSPSDIF